MNFYDDDQSETPFYNEQSIVGWPIIILDEASANYRPFDQGQPP